MRAATSLFAISVVVFFPITSVLAQSPSPVREKFWTAQWITASGAPQRDEVVLRFRKVLDLAERPKRFIVDVSADNQFILWVNQQRVASGPSRSDLANWRYETYDLAPFLRKGSNVLIATVWNFGIHRAIAQMSDRTGFLVHGDGALASTADTNASWQVEQEKGIRTIRPQLRGYYAAEPGERLDAALYDGSSNQAATGNGSWGPATILGRGARRGETDPPNNWQLVPDPLPGMEMKEIPPGRVVRVSGIESPTGFPEKGLTVPSQSKASILIDSGHLLTGYPELESAGGLGSTVRLTYAEALVDEKGEKGNRNEIKGKHIVGVYDEFLPGGCTGCQFTPLTWRTWRYLELDIETADQPLHIDWLHTWFTAYPFEEASSFQSEDSSLAGIWQTGWRTARLDAHDTYMDTPFWERLQYVGDTRIQALISYTVAGDDRLAQQAIQAFNDSRIPDGLTTSRYPSSLTQIIPTFSLLWIGMVHDFWRYRGDEDFVRAQLPGIRTVLDWYLARQRPDGLLDRLPWWPFVDWGKDFDFGMPPEEENGGSSVITLQFIEALGYAGAMESAFGDPFHATKYGEAARRAADAIRTLCWNKQYGLLADTPGQSHYSQHANILGVWLDVIPQEEQRNVLLKILSASDSGFVASGPLPQMTTATYYFRFYLARALEHAGLGDLYLRLLGPWKEMLRLGLTTWAESPEPTRSDSHAWSAHPNYDLLTIVAGLHPKTPGFKTVTIEPHIGALKQVRAALATPSGKIEVRYERDRNAVKAEVSLPSAVSGDLVWHGRTITLHGGSQTAILELDPHEQD